HRGGLVAERTERPHSPGLEVSSITVVHFEVEPVIVHQSEEQPAMVQPYSTEHVPRGNRSHSAQLLHDEFPVCRGDRHEIYCPRLVCWELTGRGTGFKSAGCERSDCGHGPSATGLTGTDAHRPTIVQWRPNPSNRLHRCGLALRRC